MYRNFYNGLLGLAFLLLCFPSLNAQDPAASSAIGRWDLEVQYGEKWLPSWLEVKLSGNKALVGYFVASGGSARPISEVHDKEGMISFSIPPQWSGKHDLHLTGTVSGASIEGTILDHMGAENLLGHGDMLFLPAGTSNPTRIHGAFVSDNEVHAVVKNLRTSGAPAFIDEILSGPSEAIPGIDPASRELDGEQDPLYDQAVRIVTDTRKASISSVQRRLKIGYNRAARMVETIEEAGIINSLHTNGSREVLAPPPPGDD